MGYRSFLIAIMLSAFALALPSHAQEASSKPDKDFKPVEGLNNWTYEYDMKDLRPGTYNILARATDSAGNVTFSTPFNMILDPDSDLPIVTIVNPLPLARVGADLNIVGTCTDDDEVAYVELRLDDGAWQRAKGQDYWSYYLQTAGIADGLHTIGARGVDSGGLAGNETKVSFHLDRTKPLHDIRAPEFGAIVSGRIRISGSVYDANGIAEVFSSSDSGQTWSPLRRSYDKKSKTANFTLSVDSTKLPDGPTVLWLKSVDEVGSEGLAVFLYFVDNTKPELVLLSPQAGQSLNGLFEVRGRAYDTVGIRSMSWTYQKETKPVELVPGNPYFNLEFMAPPKAGKVRITLSLVDVAGNISTLTITNPVDPKADLALVSVLHPAPGSTVDESLRVVGMAKDDDGVSSITWRIDSGPETTLPSSGAFSFSSDDIASGKRILFTRARDIHGLDGPWLQTPFIFSASAPLVFIDTASDASGEREARPGVRVSTLEGRASLKGTIKSSNPLVELSYTINKGLPMKLSFTKSAQDASFLLPLPASLPSGVLDVAVLALDSFGKTGSIRLPVLAIDYSRPRVGPLLDLGLASIPSIDAPVSVNIRQESPLLATFVTPFDGETIRSVRLEPTTSIVSASYEGAIVRFEATGQGTTSPTMVVVETARDHRFDTGPIIFKTDTKPPAIRIIEPTLGSWLGGPSGKDSSSNIVVEALDGDSVRSVEYAIDGGEWIALKEEGGLYKGLFDTSGETRPVRIDIKATDEAGNRSQTSTALMFDSTPPRPERLLPRNGDYVSGPTLFVIRPGEDTTSIRSLEFGRPGSLTALRAGPVVSFVADVGTEPILLRVTDNAGNSSDMDLLAGLSVQELAKNDPPPLQSIKSNAYALPPTLEESHAVVSGIDAVGALSWTAPIVDTAEVSAFPDYVSKPIRASGSVSLTATLKGIKPDPKKPVAAWGFQADAINQTLGLKKTNEVDSWTASLKLPAMPDGPVTVWIAIEDVLKGRVYTLISLAYDSTPPLIELISPLASSGKAISPGSSMLVVRATDSSGISSLSYEWGAEKAELERVPGSGDATQTLTFPPKTTSRAVTILATDGSGTRSSLSVTLSYDATLDKPTIRSLLPKEGERLPSYASYPILLYATDDDGLNEASLTLDGTPLLASGGGPIYGLDPGVLGSGKHIASMKSSDIYGIQSTSQSIAFIQEGKPPLLSFSSVSRPSETGIAPQIHAPGSNLVVDGKTSLQGRVDAAEGLSKLELSYNGGSWTSAPIPKPDTDGSYTLRCVPPSTLPFDRNILRVRVTDSVGTSVECSTSFFRVAGPAEEGSVTSEGIYLFDDRLSDGRILVAPTEQIEALWYGRPIGSVRLEPALPYAEVDFDDSRISIHILTEGGASDSTLSMDGGSRIRVETVDGDVFTSLPIHIVSDSGAPDIVISQPIGGDSVGSSFTLAGSAVDPNGIASAEWSIDNGYTWQPMPPATEAMPASHGSYDFLATLGPGIDDGALGILVRAIDRSGRSSVELRALCKNKKPPAVFFETPRPLDTVNGTILISGYAEDGVSASTIEMSTEGTSWEAVDSTPRGSSPEDVRQVSFARLLDMGTLASGGEGLAFRAIDASGNITIVRPLGEEPPAFMLDCGADKPVVQVQIPTEMETIRSNFTVSGMAFDDDGVAELFWRIDGSEWNRLDGSSSFAIPFRLLDIADNEHVFEAYAIDINGVSGDIASRSFRISQEEPVGRLESPSLDFTNKGEITLRGTASDANGISAVHVSFDSGATYNVADGTTDWTYSFDTRIIPDGVHSVFIRLFDGYDTTGFAAGLIAVDNTPPGISLDSPFDGEEGVGTIAVGGRLHDGIAIHSANLQVSKIGTSDPMIVIPLNTTSTFSTELAISDLPPGWYNIKAIAMDKAGNTGYDTRNILVLESLETDYADILFPAQGEPLCGHFTLDGRVVSSERIARAAITLDGQPYGVVELGEEGWFSLAIKPGDIDDGARVFRIEAMTSKGTAIVSAARMIYYSKEGPWVDVDTIVSGDFIIGRPYLTGTAGWETIAPQQASKAALAAHKELLKQRQVRTIEISRDNGKTWQDASGSAAYKFRLETQEYPNGVLRLLIKATFANGDTSVRKRLVILDTKAPEVSIHKPTENGRYNDVIFIEGTAYDANGLSDVSVVLRSGDKASYEVPGFIQGSYIDTHLLGATRYEAGIGLAFFDDNVKLQLAIGQGFNAQPSWDNILGLSADDTPAAQLSRFGGYVLGARLLANLAYLPFSYWFGPDWDFFSMSFALGASFTYFSMRDNIADILNPPESRYMILSGVVGQWEFAKFNLGWKVLKSIGLYVEGGMVFIPSEASTRLEEFIRPNIALGIRIGLF